MASPAVQVYLRLRPNNSLKGRLVKRMVTRSVLVLFLFVLLAVQRALHTISSVTALAPSSHLGPYDVSVAISERAPKVSVAMSVVYLARCTIYCY